MTFKRTAPGLLLPALLAACTTPTGTTPPPTTGNFTEPAAPIATSAVDTRNAPAITADVNADLLAVLSPANLDADTLAAFAAFSLTGSAFPSQPQSLNPQALGRTLAAALAAGRTPTHATSVSVTPNVPLPTGTTRRAANGQITRTATPTDGLVYIDDSTGTTATIEWRVSGAPTTSLTLIGEQGTYSVELPTRARLNVTRGTGRDLQRLAHADFTLAPGACLSSTGPDALTLNAWAGRESEPAARLNVQYAWANSGVTFAVDASLRGTQHNARAKLNVALNGTTTNRCDPNTLTFTPSAVSVNADVTLPKHNAQVSLDVRGLKNIVLSGDTLTAQNPFARIEGQVRGLVDLDGARAASAWGSLQDGPDADLTPGDQVTVRYVRDGAVVTTTLQDLLK
ncbi:hypothetical protein [Deinococcus maricopensis]|uniref:Lipoprotein n=1 Tax=Deinococcus maricopensis (strain DSM 21211 / LMG 22137 / NRRL B-23946 / LB-34) TaxID=709986 RepID=E8U3Q2_DEIML|nr:hypothetical protein [Deinococcus maricopensis]ADV68745.1 hypothetical protein Deima_3116 [Deinococcus maricopensis DSM 21211]